MANGAEVLQQIAQSGNNSIQIWELIFIGLQTIFLGITAVIVWLYTRETKKLRKNSEKQVNEIKKQTDQTIQPLVVLNFEENISPLKDSLLIENIGNGTAVNIKIQNIENGIIKFSFPNFYNLSPQTSKDIEVYRNDNIINEQKIMRKFFKPDTYKFVNNFIKENEPCDKSDPENLCFIIEYNDICLNSYKTKIKLSDPGYKIVSIERTIGD